MTVTDIDLSDTADVAAQSVVEITGRSFADLNANGSPLCNRHLALGQNAGALNRNCWHRNRCQFVKHGFPLIGHYTDGILLATPADGFYL